MGVKTITNLLGRYAKMQIEEELQSFLTYDANTGLLYRCGQAIGFRRKDGYVEIRFRGRSYLGHRVVWLLYYGTWPRGQIDHRNRKRFDNRIVNLRESNHIRNGQNRRDSRPVPGIFKYHYRWAVIFRNKYQGSHRHFCKAYKHRMEILSRFG